MERMRAIPRGGEAIQHICGIKPCTVMEAHIAAQRTLHYKSVCRRNTASGKSRFGGGTALRISVKSFHHLRADAHRFTILFIHAVEAGRLAALQPGERVAPLNAHGGEPLHCNR